jgi:hypothetical protein
MWGALLFPCVFGLFLVVGWPLGVGDDLVTWAKM